MKKSELRCSECNKKLAVVEMVGYGTVETACPRCKHVDKHAISLVPSSVSDGEGHRSPMASTQVESRRT